MSIASDVTTAMNTNRGRETDISSYTTLVLSGGGDPPVVTSNQTVSVN